MPSKKKNSPKVEQIEETKVRQIDFSKIGGLSNHLKILREAIIVPLLHTNIYTHFNIKTPRGILFYGPPGTGKTLVAGALATELTRVGVGKVSFYQRKGADVLDKWVGESERKLRTLFETATSTRPSIIFFDELDGLAPIRSPKNDHVHSSIVTTLLALMDGLDSVSGVIVIGATNRIESIDPALRRPGRFDRELYFPLPSTEARKEILQVHMRSWRHKPSQQFVNHLADATAGFCGSDLQALCAETLLCSMKRIFPNIHQKSVLGRKIKIEADEIRIEESDFLCARKNLIPSAQKLGNKMRRLSPIVQPLLQKQLDVVLTRLRMLWPHFTVQFHKYLIGTEHYAGRIVLNGSNVQGLNTHLVPAILQSFEHLPAFFLDISNLQNAACLKFPYHFPSILVIPRIDELWRILEVCEQSYVTSILEDIHSGLPILIIATCDGELPLKLQDFFYNSTSLLYSVEAPTEQEIEDFFHPLFFSEKLQSVYSVFLKAGKDASKGRRQLVSNNVYKMKENTGRVAKRNAVKHNVFNNNRSSSDRKLNLLDISHADADSIYMYCDKAEKKKRFSVVLTDLLKRSLSYIIRKATPPAIKRTNPCGDSSDQDKKQIYSLWERTVHETGKDMSVANLEVLYDTISACVSIHKENFQNLIQNLHQTLNEIEMSK